ncbi:TB2/DP1, HVA22 family-domain-containing protein [Lactarius quietus]|nr:TB2/DP1, HVA22 family-domain-containing protein [Lactarius quietus]
MSSAQQKVQQHPAFQQAQAKAHHYITQLDKELSRYPVLVSLEHRIQVPKAYAFIGAVTLFTLLHFVNAFAAPASNLIGWGLPAYLSFKALESPGHDDDTQWLTYWIIFGFFNFAEGFALRAILYYFPWYFSFKTLFVLWLQLPAFRGAQTAYYNVLKPLLTNISHRANSAEGLRDRVATATSE